MDARHGAGTPELDVRLLGPIEAERNGTPVPLGGPKPRTLLAVLALEPGRVVSVDRLVEALWPGDPPETAAHAVQVYVSQLRKALGPVIATRAPGYELELPPERVDVHRFVKLAQEGRVALEAEDPAAAEGALRDSLALWRGPALADFLYEPFAQTEIARLEELRTVVLEERITADLALARHAELVSELEALVQAQPLRERPRAQLMLALYRSGRQADALAAYRAARETLVDELGIDPGPELKELEAAILRQDASLLLEEAPLARPAMQFRRLVTILFVDVVESMALAAALDPEALGRVLQRYFETVSAAITRHGGTVEKYAGDAVMAAFGIPISHEDDALRAARAALDIRVGIAALNEQLADEHGVAIEIRIGLEAGEVVTTPTDARQRLVTGEAVGIAAKLEAAAGSEEIVVGELAGRLIDHAAVLQPLGEVEIKGKREPVLAYRLDELRPVAPVFEQRQDAKLVGRRRELAALRRSLKRAVAGSTARVALVVGSPGVGKSRLAAELTRRTKGITPLWGRCLAYGEGITYWPLREVLEQAENREERAAVLAALDAETPPPAAEIAWLFRRFCEASARERPLVLVFDDVHWAEPTFLELVEHLADKGTGPIAVVCVARDELLEERPSFLEGRGNADRILLDVLSDDDADTLVDGLGGAILESDQRARIVEAAEGNPLFLEQLLALALEGGLAERPFPETIQALLAARLDRLGPGERAVLERGAVVGKEFAADDVIALLDPDAAPSAQAHLESLAGRGFVRPRGDDAFRFRHILVQEAVYRAAPKRLRAELHEHYADRLDTESPDLPDIDEFVGFHLEQAYRLRTELGESDRRTERLAEDGGRRLGDAGIRAAKRGDMPASVGLLRRSTSILPSHMSLHSELLCDLGIMLDVSGESGYTGDVLHRAIEESMAAGERRVEVRARMEIEYFELPRSSGATADALLEATSAAIPVLEAAEDHRGLGRAWLLAGWVHGARRGCHKAREEAAERALASYKRSTWPTSICLGEIAVALYYGPTSVPAAVERCESLLRTEVTTRHGRANVETYLAGLVAQAGDFDRARTLLESARATFDDLGQRTAAVGYSGVILGDVELLADDAVAAEAVLRWVCDELERTRSFSRLASRAGDLAEALYRQGRIDEAAEWVAVGERHSAIDDVDARTLWMPVHAKVKAQRGDFDEATARALEMVALVETTDGLNRQAAAHLALGEVLSLAGRVRDADSAYERAVELFRRKGNRAGVALVDSRRAKMALV
jgi:DNA-binding SARP family transcriptional activator/tetratricopeptide (TPR) repeat protein